MEIQKARTIGIGKTGSAYIPKDIISSGFFGRVPYIQGVQTVILLNPEASLEVIENDIEILLEKIRLRKRIEEAKEDEEVG